MYPKGLSDIKDIKFREKYVLSMKNTGLVVFCCSEELQADSTLVQ